MPILTPILLPIPIPIPIVTPTRRAESQGKNAVAVVVVVVVESSLEGRPSDIVLKPILEHLGQMINEFSSSKQKIDLIIQNQNQSLIIEQQQKQMDALQLESQRQSIQLERIEDLLAIWFRNPVSQPLANTPQVLYAAPEDLRQNLKPEVMPIPNQTPALIVFETSCLDFGDSSGIHEIQVPGIEPFKVRCNSELAGSGWTVIQKRFNGMGNFVKNWFWYSYGFGSLEREFFIGLEKIYRLTMSKRYELHIHMEYFDSTTQWARYDNFLIGSEYEAYVLKSLGEFTGSTEDQLRYNINAKFTTFDRDNDEWSKGNCALEKHSGWWHKSCSNAAVVRLDSAGNHSDVARLGNRVMPIKPKPP
ncbi:angiopoietin-related protein 6-like [Drosophila tropicalis]|uniref:angiopoietin-related protein 6-like n=1 Tax=Drosophila tropicalis TaxID=46794 RepID=UPI0035AB9859